MSTGHTTAIEDAVIEDTVIDALAVFCPGVDCTACTTLFDDRILDSLTMVGFVAELEDAFDITIPPADVISGNFNSVETITALVRRLVSGEIG